jgi:hypothetical protein
LRLAILPRHPLLCYSLKCLEWVFCEVHLTRVGRGAASTPPDRSR